MVGPMHDQQHSILCDSMKEVSNEMGLVMMKHCLCSTFARLPETLTELIKKRQPLII